MNSMVNITHVISSIFRAESKKSNVKVHRTNYKEQVDVFIKDKSTFIMKVINLKKEYNMHMFLCQFFKQNPLKVISKSTESSMMSRWTYWSRTRASPSWRWSNLKNKQYAHVSISIFQAASNESNFKVHRIFYEEQVDVFIKDKHKLIMKVIKF